MRLLLDTHALIWLFEGNPRLSATAREAIDDPRAEVHVSAVSALEITTKYRIGKLPGARQLVERFVPLMTTYGFHALPISLEHAHAAGLLIGSHRDPFDRLLIAQALTDDLTLVSNEVLFDTFAVARRW